MASLWGRDGGIYLGYADNHEVNYVGDRHILLLGPNGSGKSRRLLLPNLARLTGWSMLVVDPKGELACMTGRHRAGSDIIILNPFNVLRLGSTGFNPLAGLDPTSDDFPDDAMMLAEAMIEVRGKEPHWSESAQDMLCALIMYSRLVRDESHTWRWDDEQQEEVEGDWPDDEFQRGTLGHVRTLLGRPAARMRMLARQMDLAAEKYDCPELAIKAGRFRDVTPDNKELSSIISTALTQTRWLDSRPVKRDLSKGGYDFAQMKNRPVTVYLILPARRFGTHAAWLRLIITSILQQLLRDVRKASVPCMFMLDEMAQLGYLPAIDKNLAIMRGYGVKLWCVYQDLSQLQDIYEKRWQSFVANSGVLQAFAPQEMLTSDFLSKMTGTKAADNWTHGGSIGPDAEPMQGNLGFSKISAPLMRPEELRALDEGHTIVFSHKIKNPLRCYAPYPAELPYMADIMRLDPA